MAVRSARTRQPRVGRPPVPHRGPDGRLDADGIRSLTICRGLGPISSADPLALLANATNGAARTVGVELVPAPSLRAVGAALARHGRALGQTVGGEDRPTRPGVPGQPTIAASRRTDRSSGTRVSCGANACTRHGRLPGADRTVSTEAHTWNHPGWSLHSCAVSGSRPGRDCSERRSCEPGRDDPLRIRVGAMLSPVQFRSLTF